VPVRIPLFLDWGSGLEASWTVTANEAGALVTSSRLLEAGRRVRVLNVATGRIAIARVVAPLLAGPGQRTAQAASGFRLALRLETFRARYWGDAYYAAAREETERPST